MSRSDRANHLARHRRFSVTREMIERATERRLAGDWRGACEAAGVDVRIDPDRVRGEHGAQVADALLDDLRHLVPDLVRWHFPRAPVRDRPELRASAAVTLSRPGPGLRLAVLSPAPLGAPGHRLVLELADGPLTGDRGAYGRGIRRYVEPWEGKRYLWDARYVHETRERWGGSAERAPFLNPDGSVRGPHLLPSEDPGPGGDPAARSEWAASPGRGGPGPHPGAGARRVPDDLHAVRIGLPPDHLHPVVRAALAPALPPADGPVGPPPWEPPEPVRVRCGGAWHLVSLRDGRLAGPHTDAEYARESALRALGGRSHGCFRVAGIWRTGGRGLPWRLRDHRTEFFARVRNGGTDTVLRYLAAGGDPRIRDGAGLTLLHHLAHTDHAVLLPRLLAAGLDVDAEAGPGVTPLYSAVRHGGDTALVRALIAAGARTDGLGVGRHAPESLASIVRRHTGWGLYPDAGPWEELLAELSAAE
ncbi:ankyrin repeat domain-containing protein [Nocardiopsis sp. NPDC006139]|uniref:ankyrin repeat domain-containing protein n=1 Tax=Nocardiopsis sp. NPDC006139 TaxID=3154578 RepID=UPI0033A78790